MIASNSVFYSHEFTLICNVIYLYKSKTVRLNLTIGNACCNSCKLLFLIDMSAKFGQTFLISKLLRLFYFAYLCGKTLMECIYSEINSQTRKNHLYTMTVLLKTISFNRIIQNVTTFPGSRLGSRVSRDAPPPSFPHHQHHHLHQQAGWRANLD